MPKSNDRSALLQYDVRDFVFDGLRDHDERHEATTDTVIPRTRVIETAKDRFTKASDKAARVEQIVRLDLTDRPDTYRQATTEVRERTTTVGVPAPVRRTPQQLSKTLQHFHPHEHTPRPKSRGL